MPRIRATCLLLAVLLVAGCASSSKNAPLPLNASAAQAELAVAIRGIVRIGGPGTWTHATWDEYLVTIENRASVPARIELATLEDLLGGQVPAGFDPANPRADLYKRSTANLHRYEAAHVKVKSGAFPLSNGATVAEAVLSGGYLGLLVAPAVITGLEKIAREGCASRQIALPAELPARHATTGSLFFPVTAGPTRMLIRARRGEKDSFEVSVNLPELAQLHLADKK